MSPNDDFPFAPFLETSSRMMSASLDAYRLSMLYSTGLTRYVQDFLEPFYVACGSFMEEECKKSPHVSPETNLEDFSALLRFNAQIAETGSLTSETRAADYLAKESRRFIVSLFNTFLGGPGEKVDEYMAQKAALLQRLVVDYPDAIRAIEPEYGFHFDDGTYRLAAETDRMWLYQVLPTTPGVEVEEGGKPIIIAHPYVLGPNIIAFLPGENKSYVHAFANKGIPTYARIIKNIWETEAVQVMSGEDDARDTTYFCRVVKERHGKPVTLNGFCQGGFICLADVLSRELDGLVDALISCVTPLDGTRSKGLVDYLEHISPRFRDLAYATKRLPSGHEVIDGRVMSWVYKLKSIEREAPVFTYYRDIEMFESMLQKGIGGIGKTAAAINYWLIYDRTDLPPAITQMSFDSYTIPISAEGDLPFKLFGRRLNFDYMREKGIRFLICYAGKDELVDPPAALAAQDFMEVELTEFPKGHAAIATSWSDPDSEYALHKRYPNGQRGPVRFQLDLDEELSQQIESAHESAEVAHAS